MDAEDLKRRTKAFALRIIRLVEALPSTSTARVIGNQLLRAGTSVEANYRAACRARSQAEFIARIGVVEEEADECVYWLELLIEATVLPVVEAQDLLTEATELTAIFAASGRTAKERPISRSGANPQSEIRNPE